MLGHPLSTAVQASADPEPSVWLTLASFWSVLGGSVVILPFSDIHLKNFFEYNNDS